MSDFDHDLYGDLDLEDLDATQLDEELVDPDLEPKQEPASAAGATESAAPAPSSSSAQTHAPPADNYSHTASNHVGSSSAGGMGMGGGAGGAPGGGMGGRGDFGHGGMGGGSRDFGHDGMGDRIKPSDMPDEGLVFFPLLCVVSSCRVSCIPSFVGNKESSCCDGHWGLIGSRIATVGDSHRVDGRGPLGRQRPRPPVEILNTSLETVH